MLPSGSMARKPVRLVNGAIKKPKAFKIRAPFPCGTVVHINCGYGPNCSPAHKRTNNDSGPNDYYAVDFTRVEPRNGFDKPIVAVAPGVVRFAGWTKRGWAPYGKVVYIEHLFRDQKGHHYHTLYAHLNRVQVKAGHRVKAGEIIGTLGGSSRSRLKKFGPHLHFAMYQDAKNTFGGGRAVLPEPMGRFINLRSGMDFISCGHPDDKERMAIKSLIPSTEPLAFGGLIDISN